MEEKKTIELLGSAYSYSGDCSVIMKINDSEVFNGRIKALPKTKIDPQRAELLFSFSLPDSISDLFLSVEVLEGEIFLGPIKYNNLIISERKIDPRINDEGILAMSSGPHNVVVFPNIREGEIFTCDWHLDIIS